MPKSINRRLNLTTRPGGGHVASSSSPAPLPKAPLPKIDREDESRRLAAELGTLVVAANSQINGATAIIITCPDGGSFRLAWTDRGLSIMATTVSGGSLATDIRVLPDVNNAISVKAICNPNE